MTEQPTPRPIIVLKPKCVNCDKRLSRTQFNLKTNKVTGVSTPCKVCKECQVKQHQYYLDNKEKIKQHMDLTKTPRQAYGQTYYQTHKQQLLAYTKAYEVAHPEHSNKHWRETHKAEIKEYQRQWVQTHKAQLKAYHQKNKDRYAGYLKNYHNTHKEQSKARQIAYNRGGDISTIIKWKIINNKQADRRRNLDLDNIITFEQAMTLIAEVMKNPICKYCQQTMVFTNFTKSDQHQFTFNRISNQQGHQLSNLEVCCFKCNVAMGRQEALKRRIERLQQNLKGMVQPPPKV